MHPLVKNFGILMLCAVLACGMFFVLPGSIHPETGMYQANLHDTYFIIHPFHLILIGTLFLFEWVCFFLVAFRRISLLRNTVVFVGSILAIVILSMTLRTHTDLLFSATSNEGWTIYPPLSASKKPIPSSSTPNLFGIVLLALLLSYIVQFAVLTIILFKRKVNR